MFELLQMWAFMEVLGLVFLPLTMTVFHNLPDRGWAFSKAVGLAVLAFCVWLPLMLFRLNCSSIGGMVGSKGRSAYSASKHGVIGLTRSAALDYAASGVRINAVCPGIIQNTPMASAVTKNYDPEIVKAMVAREPIGRLGEPEEVAGAVVWLCSPAASFMIGHALAVDGGILAQ